MRLGVGVSLQAQALYDTLSRTLPCRWQGTSIVVLGEVCPSVVPDADVVIINLGVTLCPQLTVEGRFMPAALLLPATGVQHPTWI